VQRVQEQPATAGPPDDRQRRLQRAQRSERHELDGPHPSARYADLAMNSARFTFSAATILMKSGCS
jgi:hypothetical protein